MEESGLEMSLDICKKIVEMNGGFISVYSEGENRGSTFMFGMKMEVPDNCELGSPIQLSGTIMARSGVQQEENGNTSLENALE